jgi:hypothetical protein
MTERDLMTNEDIFQVARDRDAWSTIRGYVYQIDLTIERWLRLLPGELLELERGEDIDTISRCLLNGYDRQRILEQVKHREDAISLRSASARVAIACAAEHRETNPSATLLFRYTTNTQVAAERPSPRPDKRPLIEVWEQIRAGSLLDVDQRETLSTIRTFLKTLSCPEDLTVNTWELLTRFLSEASDDQWLSFVRCFEWGTGSPPAGAAEPRIHKILLDAGTAADQTAARQQYERLFVYVCRLLSQPGLKQLTVHDRGRLLATSSWSQEDRDLLTGVRALLADLEQRMGVAEQRLDLHQALIGALTDRLGGSGEAGESHAAVTYTASVPRLDLPEPVPHLSQREQSVGYLIGLLKQHTWVALHGAVGSGKTELAALVARALDTSRAWIRFRGLDIARGCLHLDSALTVLTGVPPPREDPDEWYAIIAQRLGTDSLLVLDDLPQVIWRDELAERMIKLARACTSSGVRLLSSSPYPLPTMFTQALGQAVLRSESMPLLSDDEVSEILRAWGAPEGRLQPAFVRLVALATRYHPLLVVAGARFLNEHGWRLGDRELTDLIQGGYAEEISAETVHRLVATVQDEQARELLYRLSLVLGSFDTETVRALAEVNPEVAHPRERLGRAVGLWVQRDAPHCYVVSPLIAAAGTDLSTATQRSCDRLLGDRIIALPQIDPLQATSAILHYARAGEYNRAGGVLIRALGTLYGLAPDVSDYGLLSLWWGMELPAQLDLDLRLGIRGLQVAIGFKRGRDIAALLDDLDRLVEAASDAEALALLQVASLVGLGLSTQDFDRANRYVARALRQLPNVLALRDGTLPLPPGFAVESILWLPAAGARTPEQWSQWMDTLESLTPEQRANAFQSSVADEGCLSLTEQVWLVEGRKPSDERNWAAVFGVVQDLSRRADRMGLPVLWACAVRVQVRVKATFQNDLDGAVSLAETALRQANGDPRVQFLIREAVGQQFCYHERHVEAISWLTEALSYVTSSYTWVRWHALLYLSRSAGEDPGAAAEYAHQAVELVETSEEANNKDRAIVWGEYGIACWLVNGIGAAFQSWARAGKLLLTGKQDSTEWKQLFRRYGHSTAYLMSIALEDRPPTMTAGGQPYIAPYRGMLMEHGLTNVEGYDETLDSLVPAMLSAWATKLGDHDDAAEWALRGVDMARGTKEPLSLLTTSGIVVPLLLEEDRYPEALELVVTAAPIAVALEKRGPLQTREDATIDVATLLGQGPNALWRKAEAIMAVWWLLSGAFRLALIALADRQRARVHGAEVAGLCRQTALTASNPELWASAASLVERVFVDQVTGQELIRTGNGYVGESAPVLRGVAYLGATLMSDLPLKDVVAAHLAILPLLTPPEPTSLRSRSYQRLVVPFIAAYWLRRFESARFHFRAPRITEGELRQASELPVEQRAQAVMRAVVNSLGVHPPSGAEQWLRSQ